jgi:DEAD/DEAH box helicase domain-containing protein
LVNSFLDTIKNSDRYDQQIVHIESISKRDAQYGKLREPLDEPLQDVLAQLGISRLYTHQVSAIEALRDGKHVVIETGTASGKTLCYILPTLETFLNEPYATALYLFPTKALAQDQLRAVRAFAELNPYINISVQAETYDGDTPQYRRRRVRDQSNLIITNPDMLHLGILPHHSRWSRFFRNLRFVVLDEMHIYRGAFGSNVANVMRRLTRICQYYGAEPQFICCSATIANPLELAEKLTGKQMELIDNDGSPKGAKHFVLWNPPYIDEEKSYRRSPTTEAQYLMAKLIEHDIQTITFTRARAIAELIYRYVRDLLEEEAPELVDSIRAYRGGYLPEERREIERLLFSGKLLGVTSTTALELGIDVGALDACLIIGFPGTIASLWQQAGRAGRKSEDSLTVFIAYNDPVEQYLMRHPEYLFGQSPENAVIDPENVYMLVSHLRCAAHELPLSEEDADVFGELALPLLDVLCEHGDLTQIGDKWYWASTAYPASESDLRVISNDTYTIMDISRGNLVLGSMDAVNGLAMVYPNAIYMHEAETYLVRDLDLEQKIAYVEPIDADYYTQPWFHETIVITEQQKAKEWHGSQVYLGEVTVTRKTVGFVRIRFYTMENLGSESLDLPEQNLETIALWIIPPEELLDRLKYEKSGKPYEGLEGVKNVLASVLPHYAMADRQSIRGKVQQLDNEHIAIFLYDAYPGGLGFANKGYDLLEKIIEHAQKIISECECADGCPSCVRQTDAMMWGGVDPDKESAAFILEEMF